MKGLNPAPMPVENTHFKKGVSMSEQLRKERLAVERSAIAQNEIAEKPKAKRGPKPGTGGRPKGFVVKKPEVKQTSVFSQLATTIINMQAHDGIKLELMDAVVQKLRNMV